MLINSEHLLGGWGRLIYFKENRRLGQCFRTAGLHKGISQVAALQALGKLCPKSSILSKINILKYIFSLLFLSIKKWILLKTGSLHVLPYELLLKSLWLVSYLTTVKGLPCNTYMSIVPNIFTFQHITSCLQLVVTGSPEEQLLLSECYVHVTTQISNSMIKTVQPFSLRP